MLNKFGIRCLFVVTIIAFAIAGAAFAAAPVAGDSRIKTMVFNENEVYTIVTRIGFSTAIELSDKEKVQTISLGDSVGWQINPANNRVFVKPLLRNATTNLSVITNKRNYQFELVVSSAPIKNATHSYVVKFFYPEEQDSFVAPEDRTRGDLRPISATIIPEIPALPQVAAMPATPMPAAPVSKVAGLPPLGSIGIQAYNFNYTLTGPEEKSPTKIFDDGSSTYFEYGYPLNSVPQIYAVGADGAESALSVRADGNKYIVNSIAPRFVIRDGNAGANAEQICVFNEVLLASQPANFAIGNPAR